MRVRLTYVRPQPVLNLRLLMIWHQAWQAIGFRMVWTMNFSGQTEKITIADVISFVGRMDYYPNQECMLRFCKEVLPRIQAQRPRARLVIVGADPTPSIVKLGQIPGVTVTGSVPDVRDFVRRSAVMAAPLAIARGTQNKILEAMAMGVPVVTSTIAANGVDAVKNEHLLVADDAEECAQSILRVMQDRDYRRRICQSRIGASEVAS